MLQARKHTRMRGYQKVGLERNTGRHLIQKSETSTWTRNQRLTLKGRAWKLKRDDLNHLVTKVSVLHCRMQMTDIKTYQMTIGHVCS